MRRQPVATRAMISLRLGVAGEFWREDGAEGIPGETEGGAKEGGGAGRNGAETGERP